MENIGQVSSTAAWYSWVTMEQVKKRGMVCCEISSSCRPNKEVLDVAPYSNRKKLSFALNGIGFEKMIWWVCYGIEIEKRYWAWWFLFGQNCKTNQIQMGYNVIELRNCRWALKIERFLLDIILWLIEIFKKKKQWQWVVNNLKRQGQNPKRDYVLIV